MDPASFREVSLALCRMPEDVRRFALEQVVFAGVGAASAGLAMGPALLKDAKWVVPLAERSGIASTAAHEVAHALLAHGVASAEHEREAAALAGAWGFDGPSADPDGCARRFEADPQRKLTVHASIAAGMLALECKCGARCEVIAPTVPGLAADAGALCHACGWAGVVKLSELLACPTCKSPATATWADGATPDAPHAIWACTCGDSVALRLRCDASEAPDVPAVPELAEEVWAMRTAANALKRVADTLRRHSPAGPRLDAMEAEACRSGSWFARDHMLRAAHVLKADARAASLSELAAKTAMAATDLERGDFARAADGVASVADALNALLPKEATA